MAFQARTRVSSKRLRSRRCIESRELAKPCCARSPSPVARLARLPQYALSRTTPYEYKAGVWYCISQNGMVVAKSSGAGTTVRGHKQAYRGKSPLPVGHTFCGPTSTRGSMCGAGKRRLQRGDNRRIDVSCLHTTACAIAARSWMTGRVKCDARARREGFGW